MSVRVCMQRRDARPSVKMEAGGAGAGQRCDALCFRVSGGGRHIVLFAEQSGGGRRAAAGPRYRRRREAGDSVSSGAAALRGPHGSGRASSASSCCCPGPAGAPRLRPEQSPAVPGAGCVCVREPGGAGCGGREGGVRGPAPGTWHLDGTCWAVRLGVCCPGWRPASFWTRNCRAVVVCASSDCAACSKAFVARCGSQTLCQLRFRAGRRLAVLCEVLPCKSVFCASGLQSLGGHRCSTVPQIQWTTCCITCSSRRGIFAAFDYQLGTVLCKGVMETAVSSLCFSCLR